MFSKRFGFPVFVPTAITFVSLSACDSRLWVLAAGGIARQCGVTSNELRELFRDIRPISQDRLLKTPEGDRWVVCEVRREANRAGQTSGQ